MLGHGCYGSKLNRTPRFQKSIATRLNDSRSRLVLGNPEFQAAVLQIWDETEKKYNEKLRQYVRTFWKFSREEDVSLCVLDHRLGNETNDAAKANGTNLEAAITGGGAGGKEDGPRGCMGLKGTCLLDETGAVESAIGR